MAERLRPYPARASVLSRPTFHACTKTEYGWRRPRRTTRIFRMRRPCYIYYFSRERNKRRWRSRLRHRYCDVTIINDIKLWFLDLPCITHNAFNAPPRKLGLSREQVEIMRFRGKNTYYYITMIVDTHAGFGNGRGQLVTAGYLRVCVCARACAPAIVVRLTAQRNECAVCTGDGGGTGWKYIMIIVCNFTFITTYFTKYYYHMNQNILTWREHTHAHMRRTLLWYYIIKRHITYNSDRVKKDLNYIAVEWKNNQSNDNIISHFVCTYCTVFYWVNRILFD